MKTTQIPPKSAINVNISHTDTDTFLGSPLILEEVPSYIDKSHYTATLSGQFTNKPIVLTVVFMSWLSTAFSNEFPSEFREILNPHTYSWHPNHYYNQYIGSGFTWAALQNSQTDTALFPLLCSFRILLATSAMLFGFSIQFGVSSSIDPCLIPDVLAAPYLPQGRGGLFLHSKSFLVLRSVHRPSILAYPGRQLPFISLVWSLQAHYSS